MQGVAISSMFFVPWSITLHGTVTRLCRCHTHTTNHINLLPNQILPNSSIGFDWGWMELTTPGSNWRRRRTRTSASGAGNVDVAQWRRGSRWTAQTARKAITSRAERGSHWIAGFEWLREVIERWRGTGRKRPAPRTLLRMQRSARGFPPKCACNSAAGCTEKQKEGGVNEND